MTAENAFVFLNPSPAQKNFSHFKQITRITYGIIS